MHICAALVAWIYGFISLCLDGGEQQTNRGLTETDHNSPHVNKAYKSGERLRDKQCEY